MREGRHANFLCLLQLLFNSKDPLFPSQLEIEDLKWGFINIDTKKREKDVYYFGS